MAKTPGQKAAHTRRVNEMRRGCGMLSVYVCHAVNFGGTLRPAYDTAPTVRAELTLKQADRLRYLIARFMRQCHEENHNLASEG